MDHEKLVGTEVGWAYTHPTYHGAVVVHWFVRLSALGSFASLCGVTASQVTPIEHAGRCVAGRCVTRACMACVAAREYRKIDEDPPSMFDIARANASTRDLGGRTLHYPPGREIGEVAHPNLMPSLDQYDEDA